MKEGRGRMEEKKRDSDKEERGGCQCSRSL